MSQKVTSFRDVAGLDGVRKVVNAPRKSAADKLGEALVGQQMVGAEDGTKDFDALLAFDEKALREANSAEVEEIEDQVNTLRTAAERTAKAKQLLADLQAENRKRGVVVDTPVVQRLKAMLDAGEATDDFEGEAVVIARIRERDEDIKTTIAAAQAVVRDLKSGKDVGSRLDEVIDTYYDYFFRLRKERLLTDVLGAKLQEWSEKKLSFSDRAFAAKNHEGHRFWFWGVKGNGESMVLCKSMVFLYAIIDRAMYLQKKAVEKAAKAAAIATPTATAPAVETHTEVPIDLETPVSATTDPAPAPTEEASS